MTSTSEQLRSADRPSNFEEQKMANADETNVADSAATHSSLSIVVGQELFAFASFDQWVNKAAGLFRSYRVRSDDVLSVDSVGRICRVGKQFMRARDEGTFPIRVFLAVVD